MTQDQAPPVLLVHGFASSAEHNWRHPGWLDLLADCGRETIAIDLPGHGTAPKPADPASYHNVEAHVAAAVEGREPLDAIGFSAGAHVLLRLAADQPGTFRRLALLGIGRGVPEPADPEPIVAALTSEPDPENVTGMVFRRLADGLGNDRAALPDARLVTLRGVDHFGTPADVHCMQAVLGFLGC
jgi:pimeloyl-ACP methyl ester carboxylesterase